MLNFSMIDDAAASPWSTKLSQIELLMLLLRFVFRGCSKRTHVMLVPLVLAFLKPEIHVFIVYTR